MSSVDQTEYRITSHHPLSRPEIEEIRRGIEGGGTFTLPVGTGLSMYRVCHRCQYRRHQKEEACPNCRDTDGGDRQ